MNDKERKAAEARRLFEEIKPYLDTLEYEAFQDLVATKWWHPFGRRTRDRLLERCRVIRDLKSRIAIEARVIKQPNLGIS